MRSKSLSGSPPMKCPKCEAVRKFGLTSCFEHRPIDMAFGQWVKDTPWKELGLYEAFVAGVRFGSVPETKTDGPIPHHVQYDLAGWLCSICGGFNANRLTICQFPHRDAQETSASPLTPWPGNNPNINNVCQCPHYWVCRTNQCRLPKGHEGNHDFLTLNPIED